MNMHYIASIAVLHRDNRLEAKTFGLKFELPDDIEQSEVDKYNANAEAAIERKVQELIEDTGAKVEYRVTKVRSQEKK